MGIMLSVVGIIIGLAFGVYSVWTYRKSKRLVSLDFRNRECYSLFRDDVKRLNVDVGYNGAPQSNSLILLKARLVNSGVVDIDKNRIHSSLKIVSSSKYKWLEASITSATKGAVNEISIDDEDRVEVNWDLLKSGEVIEIEALAEVVDDDYTDQEAGDFYESLKFDFRITDLNEIQKDNVKAEKERKEKRSDIFTIAWVLFMVIGGGITLLMEFFPAQNIVPRKHDVQFEISDVDGNYHGRIISSSENGVEIDLEGVDGEVNMTVEDFNKNYNIESINKTYIESGSKWLTVSLAGLYFLMGMILLIKYIQVWKLQRVNKNLKKKIESRTKTSS